jgi:small subunit ribosomal protein S16
MLVKRDGKYLENWYLIKHKPATIELNLDSAVNGCTMVHNQLTKAILSYKGALLKHHLDGGIRKGALTQEQADAKLAAWLEAKTVQLMLRRDGLTKHKLMLKQSFKAEQEVNAKRLAAAAEAEADYYAATPAVEEEVAEVEAEEAPAAEENNEETQA